MNAIHRAVVAGASAAALAVTVAAAGTPHSPSALAGFSSEGLAKIPAALQDAVDSGRLPGIVTLIWRRGEVVQVNAIGFRNLEQKLPMERRTLFRIASMSKPITSVAALMLIEEGKLALDDPITTWAPEFAHMRVLRRPDGPLEDTYPAPRVITIEDLMTHRSGLSYGFTTTGPLSVALNKALGAGIESRLSPDEWMKTLADLPLAYAPGERFQYGHSTDVLGIIVGRAAETSLRQFLLARVFEPLGMSDTDFWIPPDKRERAAVVYAADPAGETFRRVELPSFVGRAPQAYTSGGQGLVSTADDYLTFARMLLNNGEVNGVRLLKPETVRMMTTNRLTPAQRQIPFLGTPAWMVQGFGLGVSMITNPQAYAMIGAGAQGAFSWPGGFGGWWQADPAQDIVALFLPQILPTRPPGAGTPISATEIAQAMNAMRAFQKLVYAAIER